MNTLIARPLSVRWMIRNDLKDVLAIEQAQFEFPWSEDDFLLVLRKRNCIGQTAEVNGRLVGYMIYELHKTRFHLLNVAACPVKCGVGRALVGKLIGKLSEQRRRRVTCEVRESNLDAQLFFKAMGFRAVSVLKGFYDDTPEDAYLMHYRLKVKPEVD